MTTAPLIPGASTHPPVVEAPGLLVIGIDLSLTATGISDGRTVHTVRSKAKADATLAQRKTRLGTLRGSILEYCVGADLVVVEQPAYASASGHMHDRSGLWWMVVAAVSGLGITVVEVIPQHVKMYATGKGIGSKDTIMAAAIRRYPAVAISNNNEADSQVLAALGLRWLGHPIDDLPLTHLRAMDKVKWPVTT